MLILTAAKKRKLPNLRAALSRAREDEFDDDVPGLFTEYNSDEDDVPVFEAMKAEFPGLTFEFSENPRHPSFRWQAGEYEWEPERIVLPGSGQSILVRNFRVVSHSATRNRLVRALRALPAR